MEKATRRLMLVEDDQLPTAQRTIAELRDQRSDLNRELQAVSQPVCGTIPDLDSHVAKLLNRLRALKTDPTRADIDLTREFAQHAIKRVDLDVDSRRVGTRHKYRLTGGRIELRQLCMGLLVVHPAQRSRDFFGESQRFVGWIIYTISTG